MVILESHCCPRLQVYVHSQESKPESCMAVFCIISDIRPVSDMYHRFAVAVYMYILYTRTHSYYNIYSVPAINRDVSKLYMYATFYIHQVVHTTIGSTEPGQTMQRALPGPCKSCSCCS